MNPNAISIEVTNKILSSKAGISCFAPIIDQLNLKSALTCIFPQKKKGITPFDKYNFLLNGLIDGAQCLEDLDELKSEAAFDSLLTPIASNTAGEFLRSFESRDIEKLSQLQLQKTLELRRFLAPRDKKFMISLDSTPHLQTGKKMEGLDWNYKNQWCLDSLNAYDQYGLSYGFHLRPGNSYSGNDAEWMIGNIFKSCGYEERYFRADSAYGNLGVYNTLLNHKVRFAIALKENVYRSILEKNKNVQNWKRSKLEFFGRQESEVSNAIYPVKGLAGRSYLRVVFVRTKKTGQLELLGDGYSYYAIATNMFEHEMKIEEVFAFYRGRANAENFIRDQKYGFDLKHFPCQKLNANYVYGLIAQMAYNLTRFVSFQIDKRGCFAKRVRRVLIHLPCQVVKHARKITLRLNHYHKEVLEKITKKILYSFVET
jgi:hypothetical protein